MQLLGGIFASLLVLMALLSGLPEHDVASHGLAANSNAQGMSTFALLLWEVLLTALFLFIIGPIVGGIVGWIIYKGVYGAE